MTVLDKRESGDEVSNTSRKKVRLSGCLNIENSKKSWSADKSFIKPQIKMRSLAEIMNNYGTSNTLSDTKEQPDDNSNENGVAVSSLLNLGNTCFLNSVLYTLRFAPLFLHKLHHLQIDSAAFVKNVHTGKLNVERSNYSSGRATFGNDSADLKIHAVIEKLHYVYKLLTENEYKSLSSNVDPIEPSIFLHALREVNPMFEGNQQHDAHELLVCVLDIIREVCQVLYHQNSSALLEAPTTIVESSSSNPLFKAFRSITHSLKLMTNNEKDPKDEDAANDYHVNSDQPKSSFEDDNDKPSVNVYDKCNTIFEDFQGVSVLCTTCGECEQVTEMKETFCDICIPIQTTNTCDDVDAINQLYHSMILTEDHLVGNNKYWCDKCNRYNEAKRSVKYQRLPRLLTLHFKRFSTNYGSRVYKVNDYMPTSFKLYCFCEECNKIKRPQDRPHHYELYSIIMHLGPSMASGHYVAYVKTFYGIPSSADSLGLFVEQNDICRLTNSNNNNSNADVLPLAELKQQHALSRMCSFNCSPFSEHNKLLQLLKKYKSKNSSPNNDNDNNGNNNNNNNNNNNSSVIGDYTADKLETLRAVEKIKSCKADECCGIRVNAINTSGNNRKSSSSDASSSSCSSFSYGDNDGVEPIWLECDDECIRAIKMNELMDMLGPRPTKNHTATPYLLFYARNTVL